jgi:hypothetical protein
MQGQSLPLWNWPGWWVILRKCIYLLFIGDMSGLRSLVRILIRLEEHLKFSLTRKGGGFHGFTLISYRNTHQTNLMMMI